MRFKVIVTALLLTSLTAFAAPPKKTAKGPKHSRKVASEVVCVPLNKVFEIEDEYDGSLYTADELSQLRNSIFAQYGFKFTDPVIAADMKKLGCQNESAVYDYSKLTKIDKQNISSMKYAEQHIRESKDFAGEWNKHASTPRERVRMLENKYCHMYNPRSSDGKLGAYAGILFFSSKKSKNGRFKLEGMLDLSKATYIPPESEEGKKEKADPKTLQGLDATSIGSVDRPARGNWNIADDGTLEVTIKPYADAGETVHVKIDAPSYIETGIVSCELLRKF